MQQHTGRADPRLQGSVPAAVSALWGAWLDLSRTRPPAQGGAAPITYSELQAWQRATGCLLTAWEIDTLMAADAAARAAFGTALAAGDPAP